MEIDRVKLIALMAERRMSINELSQKAGVGRVTISYIRSGKVCSDKTGKALADALQVPLESLLREEAGL